MMRRIPMGVVCAVLLLLPAVAHGQSDEARFGDRYRAFLDSAKTPAEVVTATTEAAGKRGFKRARASTPIDSAKPGDRLYFVNRDRSVFFVVIGARPVVEGVRLVAAHADAPSLVLDPLPLGGRATATLSARPYGGIKSHLYDAVPLEIRGRVVRRGGEIVDVRLGGDDRAFMARPLDTDARISDKPERNRDFELIAATVPARNGGAQATLRRALYDEFGITENDLKSAELYAVPTWLSRDVGLDRSAVAAFGQDDRACSFAAFRALTDRNAVPEHTAIVALVDREEIGSTGVTGMRSDYFRMMMGTLLEAQDLTGEQALRRSLERSSAISSDVTAGLNPLYAKVHSPANTAVFGAGPALMKYTGSRGKVGGSDANPELIELISRIFAEADVPLQHVMLGRVDEGGGGTVAKFLASQGVDVVDVGIGLISMHSPLELAHKRDMFGLYRGLGAYFYGAKP